MLLKNNQSPKIAFISISLITYLSTSLIFLYIGKIHVDEPFYFTIANLVKDGYLPYLDFFYTQTPLFPYIFSLPQFIFGSSLYTARLTSIFFGLLTFIFLIELCIKKKSITTAVIASALVGFNPYLIYHFTFVKLYSLLAFFLVLTVRILLSDLKAPVKYTITALLLTLSFGIRITTLPAFIIVAIYLLIIKKELKSFLIYAASGFIFTLLIFAPFIIKAKDQMLYGIWGYLMDRDVLPISGIIKAKFLFLSEFSQHFGLFIILLFLIALNYFRINKFKNLLKINSCDTISLSWLILIILALPLLLTKISYVSEYLSFLMPLLAILIGFELAPFFDSIDANIVKRTFAAAFLSACLITWFANAPDFIGKKNKIPPIKYLNQVSQYIKHVTEKDSQILSFNNAIVVLSDRKILPGYEMNSCSFDPKWNDERCKKHSIMNVDMLCKIIKNKDVGAILITKNTFLGNFPSFYNLAGVEVTRDTLMPIIKDNYKLEKVFSELGNFNEDAYLYLPIQEKDITYQQK